MNTTNISNGRVEEIIEAYGANPACWPEQERDPALEMLAGSATLQERYRHAQQLDTRLLDSEPAIAVDEDLLARVVDNLPTQLPVQEQPVQQQVSRGNAASRWQLPAAAAAVILAVLVSVLTTTSPISQPGSQPGLQGEQLALQDIDYWLWQDVTDQASFDATDDAPTDFLAIL